MKLLHIDDTAIAQLALSTAWLNTQFFVKAQRVGPTMHKNLTPNSVRSHASRSTA
jgi:hypothetical protein